MTRRRRSSNNATLATVKGVIVGILIGYLVSALSSSSSSVWTQNNVGGIVGVDWLHSRGSTIITNDNTRKSHGTSRILENERNEEGSAIAATAANYNEEKVSTKYNKLEINNMEKLEELVKEEVEKEEENDLAVTSTAIIIIILILIALTLAFEAIKEYITEYVDSSMKPIVEKLFGEMTVLGFLSIFTYVVVKFGLFRKEEEIMYAKGYEREEAGEGEELEELFENVHFALFFIMVFFVFQVLTLVKEGMENEKEWHDMDLTCRNEAHIEKVNNTIREKQKQHKVRTKVFRKHSFTSLLPNLRDTEIELAEDQLLFFRITGRVFKRKRC
mmetsp:Transcript_51159/g.76662  ORF Transcript_51159/g.76662 Transcript_51159/m.76662 type:complete len:330 (+) Transcript_51159:230-1219(+)